jgi:DNA-binding response OmpR family regulator
MPDQWPRALLRAALRDAGYDALGAPGLAAALRYRAQLPGRGPVRVIVVDQAALGGEDWQARLDALSRRHSGPDLLLLARALTEPPNPGGETGWRDVVRRPVSIADLVGAVQASAPLRPEAPAPLD